jgi:uncharacterized Zn-finger protein
MKTFETIEVDTEAPSCDGGGGPLGHPRVYLTMGPRHDVYCPYCSRHFVLKASAAKGGAH